MLFEKKYLKEQFKKNSGGMEPEEFITEKSGQLLDIWIEYDKGEGLYKNTGPYWELLYGILKEYVPEKLKIYSKKVGPFNFFNEKIKIEYSYDNDLLNFMAALSYLEEREKNYKLASDVHYIESNGMVIPYMPNQNIEASLYLGRDNGD